MGKIVVLPPHWVNKIAAGEVVERPASVLKELLENSLDAGARRIVVDLEEGGKKLIRVADDGGGIAGDELGLAVAAHATSKLAREEDLYGIQTLGFRGEALASIASVSQLELVSRPGEALEGARLEVQGGEQRGPMPAAAPPGTAVAVRNLFWNTPARRKFLRATNTELGHLIEAFTRVVLAYPQVHFTLAHNGRTLYELPAGQALRERIGTLFSRDLADDLLSVVREDPGLKVGGLVAPPRQARSSSQWQYVFVNGRCIRDRFIGHAVREAYRGLLEGSRQPVVFLFLQMPAELVDVNVHPAKSEVRFADANRVHSSVLAAIRDRLLSTDLTAAVGREALHSDEGAGARAVRAADGRIEEEEDRSGGGGESQDARRARVRQAMADFFKSASLSRPAGRCGREWAPAEAATAPPQPAARAREAPATGASERTGVREEEGEPGAPARRFVQLHNSYLVTETEEGVLIIDQHALHERILYEQLQAQLGEGRLASQRRLIPETVEATAKQMAAAEDAAEMLRQLGIVLERFGPRSLAIQGFPGLLEQVAAREFVSDLLDLVAGESGRASREELLHRVLDMMACKAAIKAGDPLTDGEIEALLSRRQGVERSSNCPHGRPTTIRLSLSQLDKEFKRT